MEPDRHKEEGRGTAIITPMGSRAPTVWSVLPRFRVADGLFSNNRGSLAVSAVMEAKSVLHADTSCLFSLFMLTSSLWSLTPKNQFNVPFFSRLPWADAREPESLHQIFHARPLTVDQKMGVGGSKAAEDSLPVQLPLCALARAHTFWAFLFLLLPYSLP